MVRLLAIADEEDRALTVARLRAIQPDLVVSCGDLGPDYLDFVGSAANAPLLYVPGNHDPDPSARRETGTYAPPEPSGVNLDATIVVGHDLRFAGLGGSVRYRLGPTSTPSARCGGAPMR